MTTAVPVAAMDRLIDNLDRLHSAPQVICRVLTLLQDDDYETDELADCLEVEPALASAVLRLVNSSYFGLPRNVASLKQAITFLGSRSLRLAVLSFGLLERLTEDAPAAVYEDFWRRCLTMASVGFRLAAHQPELAGDEAYTAGLLADIGILLLAQSDTTAYVKLHMRAEHGATLIDSERERYGFHHGQLGARLLARWNLPPLLAGAIADHHESQRMDDPLRLNTLAASLMADALWTPASPHVGDARRLLDAAYGIDLDGFITLAIDCKETIQENAALYQVSVPITIDCGALLAEARKQYREEAMMAALDWDSLAAVAEEHEQARLNIRNRMTNDQ